MTPSIWGRLDNQARRMVPFLLTFTLVIFTAVPTRLPGFAELSPSWPLVGVFYWSIYRPDLFPSWAAFLLGTLADIVAGTPLGINAMILLLVRSAVVIQRRFLLGHSFGLIWGAFVIVAVGAMGLQWLLFATITGQGMDPAILMWQYVVVMGLYPVLTLILAYTQTLLLREH